MCFSIFKSIKTILFIKTITFLSVSVFSKKFFINFSLFDVKVFYLGFKLAFDKNLGLIFLFLMEKLNIQFETFDLLFENIDIDKYNISYYFESEDILVIIVLMFKELMSDNHNTCQNCGYYFVSSN